MIRGVSLCRWIWIAADGERVLCGWLCVPVVLGGRMGLGGGQGGRALGAKDGGEGDIAIVLS